MTDINRSLLAVLNAMGARKSNPVLEVIADNPAIELEKKYPANNGYFGNHHWRAFYHCHDSPGKSMHEHGHFHIFINAEGNPDSRFWPHLAGLSMNNMGQPYQWFTVNQWVTSGHWLPAQDIVNSLTDMDVDEHMSLVEKWLVCMINCYHEEISRILLERDTILKVHGTQDGYRDVLSNRDIYLLSKQTIDLQRKLTVAYSMSSSNNINERKEVIIT